MIFNTWHHLILLRHHFGVQRLSLSTILAAIMALSVFHATVTSVTEFCILKAVDSISESYTAINLIRLDSWIVGA